MNKFTEQRFNAIRQEIDLAEQATHDTSSEADLRLATVCRMLLDELQRMTSDINSAAYPQPLR